MYRTVFSSFLGASEVTLHNERSLRSVERLDRSREARRSRLLGVRRGQSAGSSLFSTPNNAGITIKLRIFGFMIPQNHKIGPKYFLWAQDFNYPSG